MAKTKISEFDVDPANNTDINSINIAEGCAPSGINNAIRQLMSDLKAFQTGADGDPFNGAVNGTVGATTPAAGAFTTLSASGAFSANGGATLGDASGDALTINSSAVSIPNGLNFDSNTLVIDATNNRVGVGTASPATPLHVAGDVRISDTYSLLMGSGAEQKILAGGTSSSTYLTFNQWTGSAYTERMRIDSSGNLGLGVTPSAWGSPLGSAFLEAKNGMHFGSISTSSSIGYIGINSYYNGTNWIYKNSSAYANRYELNSGNTGSHAWFTAASGTAGNNITFTQAMTLNASGNLGIGTSSPSYKLHVLESALGNVAYIGTTDGTYNPRLIISSSSSTGMTLNATSSSGGGASALNLAVAGTIYATLNSSGNLGLGVTPSTWDTIKPIEIARAGNFVGGSGSASAVYLGANTRFSSSSWRYANNGAAALYTVEDNTHFWRNAASGTAGNAISFTQAMTLDSSGNLLINTTAVSTSNLNGTAIRNFAGGSFVEVAHNTSAVSGNDYAVFRYNGTNIGSIVQNGTTQVTYATSSDYRLKDNISPMTGALAKVAQLKPCTYTWKSDGSDGQGFIAHELQAIVPECVTGEKDAVDAEGNPKYQGIDTSFLVATLTASIQELKAIVDAQAARIAVLESK